VSTDEEPRPAESIESMDADAAPRPNGAVDAASADTVDELRDIEAKPLVERAAGYQELADRLRAELEHSDPSRGPS
jgi:hypothetical protein